MVGINDHYQDLEQTSWNRPLQAPVDVKTRKHRGIQHLIVLIILVGGLILVPEGVARFSEHIRLTVKLELHFFSEGGSSAVGTFSGLFLDFSAGCLLFHPLHYTLKFPNEAPTGGRLG